MTPATRHPALEKGFRRKCLEEIQRYSGFLGRTTLNVI
jgi:hypothetical protein